MCTVPLEMLEGHAEKEVRGWYLDEEERTQNLSLTRDDGHIMLDGANVSHCPSLARNTS